MLANRKYLKATYYHQEKTLFEYEYCLRKSIELYSYHSNNYLDLGRLLLSRNQLKEGKEFITGTEITDIKAEMIEHDTEALRGAHFLLTSIAKINTLRILIDVRNEK